MLQSALLPTSLFQDVITDLSYSYYGTSLAVASADHRVRIFTLSDPSAPGSQSEPDGGSSSKPSGRWELEEEWKAHDAPLTRVCWAHPAYGPVLATAAFDRTVKIWEDVPSRAAGLHRARWVERKTLTDPDASVQSLEFAPEPLGLKLAGVGSGGWVRIWECLDLSSLAMWELREELDMVALVGSATPMVEKEAGFSHWAQAAVVAALRRLEWIGGNAGRGMGGGKKELDQGWALAWCAERWWGDVLAVCCGTLGVIKIMQFPGGNTRPITLCTLLPPPPRNATASASDPPFLSEDGSMASSQPLAVPLTSVAWAPGCGRSFHLIAAGSGTGEVFLWKVVPRSKEGIEEEGAWSVELVGEFKEHGGRSVGRVQFNPTGTILSSAGDDGRIRLWKASFTGVWRAMGSVYATAGEEDVEGEDEDMDGDGDGEEEGEGEEGYES